MLLLGIDIGTSFIKACVLDADSGKVITSAKYPEKEAIIISDKPGWAEQSPDIWWQHTVKVIKNLHATNAYNPVDIEAIGIAYQMHGLVVVDKDQHVLRDSIIWCDSRAVSYGEAAFEKIGTQYCLSSLLNSPGNFTAAKLAWVKKNEPAVYAKIDKVMLPGDFISMKLTGKISSSASALSEAVLWDFKKNEISQKVLQHFQFDEKYFSPVQNVFSDHGKITNESAQLLLLKKGIAVTYKVGDQPNNALSLNAFNPGDVAATAGTSGVIYGISDQPVADKFSRVNSFAHVNHTAAEPHIGVLLCINGAGITNKWIRNIAGGTADYDELNNLAKKIPAGSEGLKILPFGNGAERMLQNKTTQAHLININYNRHTAAHIYKAGQEAVVFSFRYGLDIMQENGIKPATIKAGNSNMFLSRVFTEAFVNTTGVPVEIYDTDGSTGAAIGAGIGAGIFKCSREAFINFKPIQIIYPSKKNIYETLYREWKEELEKKLIN